MPCPRCEQYPSLQGPHLFLWAPQDHTALKIGTLLDKADVAYTCDLSRNLVQARISDPALSALTIRLFGALSEAEMRDTRALLSPTETPGFDDLPKVQTLGALIFLVRERWLGALIAEDRLLTYGHEIRDPAGTVIGTEMLTRGVDEDGLLLSANALFGAAKTPEQLALLDRAARVASVRASQHLPEDRKIFINFVPSAIYDPAFCLRTTVSEASKIGLDPSRVVFEVVETEDVTDVDSLKGILRFYRSAGFKVALDDFGAGYSNLGLLTKLRPDLVKIDKHLTEGLVEDRLAGSLFREIVRIAKSEGITCLAEGVETEAIRDAAIDAGVDLLQGWLWGKPAPVAGEPVADAVV